MGGISTKVESHPSPTQHTLKSIKLSQETYEELSRLKAALDAKSYDVLIRRLIECSEVDPLRAADRRIGQLEQELGQIAPHAYGAISQALVLCRVALQLERAQCEALQMELLSVLREVRKGLPMTD